MDGRHLFRALREFGCSATEVEASLTATESAKKRFPQIEVDHGVAPSGLEDLAVDRSFDVIVAGFFLYLLPRPMLFRTASAIDSLLQVNGFLIISDFLSLYSTRRTYSHDEDFTVYKLDYSQAWTWNPQYTQVHRLVGSHSGSTRNIPSNQQEWVGVDVLMKRDPETTCSFVP